MAPTLNLAAYRFVAIDDLEAVAYRVRALCEQGVLKGSVLVAPEGINLFLAGAPQAVRALLPALGEDRRFSGMDGHFSESSRAPFRRLRVRCKREIIRFDRPALAPAAQRAPTVSPERLRDWLRQGHDDAGRPLALLDTRNREEVAHGTFVDAIRLPIDRFTQFPEAVDAIAPQLADRTVVSFCTGGIRCEKAALWLRAAGHCEALQLDGGILGYFRKVGGEAWQGRCFVFDERVAVDPQLRPLVA